MTAMDLMESFFSGRKELSFLSRTTDSSAIFSETDLSRRGVPGIGGAGVSLIFA